MKQDPLADAACLEKVLSIVSPSLNNVIKDACLKAHGNGIKDSSDNWPSAGKSNFLLWVVVLSLFWRSSYSDLGEHSTCVRFCLSHKINASRLSPCARVK